MRKKDMSGWSVPFNGVEAKEMTGFANSLRAVLQRFSYKFNRGVNQIEITLIKNEDGTIGKDLIVRVFLETREENDGKRD